MNADLLWVQPATIERAVCDRLGFKPAELREPRRTATIVLARHLVCYLLRTRCKFSFFEIGRRMERDHSTIMHAVSRIDREIAKGDAAVMEHLREINHALRSSA